MASQGPNITGTGVNLTGVGALVWVNPSYITAADGSFMAQAQQTYLASTNYLKATNFGFSIPSGATIDGIVVEHRKQCSYNTTSRYGLDEQVKLIKAGTIVGSNLADTTTKWSTSLGWVATGTSTSLWGTSWTDTDINDSNFGVVLNVTVKGLKPSSTIVQVDAVRITVYYTTGGGGGGSSANSVLIAGD